MAKSKSKTETEINWSVPGWALAQAGWPTMLKLNERYQAGLAALKASSQIQSDVAQRAAGFSQKLAAAQVEGLKSLSEVRNFGDLVRAQSTSAQNALDLYASEAQCVFDVWTRASEIAARQFGATEAAEPPASTGA